MIMAVYYVEILRLVEGNVRIKSCIWCLGPDSNVKNRCADDIRGKLKHQTDQAVDY